MKRLRKKFGDSESDMGSKKLTAHSYKTRFKAKLLDTSEPIQERSPVVTDKNVQGTLFPESASESRRVSVCSVRKRVNSDLAENDLCSCGGAVNKDLGLLCTCKKRAQYSNGSLRDPNLDVQDISRESFNERGAESVLSKLTDVEKDIGVKSPCEEHGRSETDDKILELERMCRSRGNKLQRKQLEKIQEFHKVWDEKREQLTKDLQLETAFIRSVFSEVSVRTEKLKRLDEAFACKIDKHNLTRDVELKNLKAEQLSTRNAEKQKVERWLTAAKACNAEPVAVDVPPLIDDNAGVSQLEINTTVDATRVVSESVEQAVDKSACQNESTRHCQDQNFKENNSPQHLKDQIRSESESRQHLEGQIPSGSVCVNGNTLAPANTSNFSQAYPVHCDMPTEMRMRNLVEPITSGIVPPGIDPSTCRAIYIGNVHQQVTESLLQDVFAVTGPIEGCRLIKREKSSCGFVRYFDHRSAALAIQSFNGRHVFGEPINVNWAYGNGQRQWVDTSSYYNIFVGGLTSEVTDAMLYSFFSVYPSCSYALVMRDKITRLHRGFGFVSFTNQQDAQSAINDFTGKWLGSWQIFCNWATRGATSYNMPNSDAKSVVELINGSSDDLKEVALAASGDAPESNPQYTTVYVGSLAPEVTQADLHRHFHALGAGSIVEVYIQREKAFGLVRYSTHAEATLAISMGNKSYLFGRLIKCSWGTKPTPPGTSSNPLPPPQSACLFSSELVAYARYLAICKMSAFNTCLQPAQGQLPLEQGGSVGGMGAGANQAISDGGFQNVAPYH